MATMSLHSPEQTSHRHASWWGVAAIVLAVAAVAVIGGWVTASSVRTWYPDVAKPSWTPPNWVFGPVWAVLYAMMAVAASVVWLSRDRAEVCCPMSAFAVQLVLNLAWRVLFFGFQAHYSGSWISACCGWRSG